MLFLAGSLKERQCVILGVITIDFKGDTILCIGTPITAMLYISSDILATSSPVLRAILNNNDSSKGWLIILIILIVRISLFY